MGLQKLIFSETNPCLEYVPSNAGGISDSLGADRGLGGENRPRRPMRPFSVPFVCQLSCNVQMFG